LNGRQACRYPAAAGNVEETDRMTRLIVAAALGLLGAGAALAQQNPQTACRGDYFKFCSAHRPGTPGVEQCFKENLQKVSEACRTAIRATYGDKAK
jgi:hypothetical protein